MSYFTHKEHIACQYCTKIIPVVLEVNWGNPIHFLLANLVSQSSSGQSKQRVTTISPVITLQ